MGFLMRHNQYLLLQLYIEFNISKVNEKNIMSLKKVNIIYLHVLHPSAGVYYIMLPVIVNKRDGSSAEIASVKGYTRSAVG